MLSSGEIDQVRVLSFDEPAEYLPKPKWFDVFLSKMLSPSLELHRDVPMVTGATLSAKAATTAVRRMLTIHALLKPQSTAKHQQDSRP
ncbi:FMN-binding protein [bacterium]|nr:FMN-binding protein [bacterium]